MSPLPMCGRPGCKNPIDPRWYGWVDGEPVRMCDGCGGEAYDADGYLIATEIATDNEKATDGTR